MMRRFVSYVVPAAALLFAGCGPEELPTPSESPTEAPAVAKQEQGLTSVIVHDFPLGFYVPPRTAGDADFAGNGPKMEIDFELEVRNGNELWIGMFIWGSEVGGTTRVQGHRYYHIATTPTPIQAVSPSPTASIWDFPTHGPEFRFVYTDTGHSLDSFYFEQVGSNSRIVKYLSCVGDTAGDEAGTKTGCSAVLHSLTISF
jgi:hypothetical protein